MGTDPIYSYASIIIAIVIEINGVRPQLTDRILIYTPAAMIERALSCCMTAHALV